MDYLKESVSGSGRPSTGSARTGGSFRADTNNEDRLTHVDIEYDDDGGSTIDDRSRISKRGNINNDEHRSKVKEKQGSPTDSPTDSGRDDHKQKHKKSHKRRHEKDDKRRHDNDDKRRHEKDHKRRHKKDHKRRHEKDDESEEIKDEERGEQKDEEQGHRKDEENGHGKRKIWNRKAEGFDLGKCLVVIELFVPITLCMVIVVFSVVAVPELSAPSDIQKLYFSQSQSQSQSGPGPSETGLNQSQIAQLPSFESNNEAVDITSIVLLVLALMGIVIVMTTSLLFLYYYKFYRVLFGYMVFTSFTILFFVLARYLERVLQAFNIPTDYITFSFFMLNFGVLGMLSIYWKAPLHLQQFYHVVVSAMMALYFYEFLPHWVAWIFLGFMCAWDLVAVLCPYGPLRLLVKTAQERDEPIMAALIYSSKMIWFERRTPSSAKTVVAILLNHENNDLAAVKVDRTTGDRVHRCSTSVDAPPVVFVDQNMSRKRPSSSSVGTSGDIEEEGDSESDEVDSKAPATVMTPSPSQTLPEENEQDDRFLSPRTDDESEERRDESDDKTDDEEDAGIKLGLGDFIFYSLLVGLAAKTKDWNVIIICYIAILVGLCLTLFILAMFHKPLPALPISIMLGIVFNFTTVTFITPFQGANQGTK